MLSTLELRHLIEQSFLPIRCECTVDTPATLTVRFYENISNREILIVRGISIAQLNSGHAIATLIAGLRKNLLRVRSTPRNSANHSANR